MSPHVTRRQRCAVSAALRGCGPVTGAGRVLGLRYAPDAQSLLVWRAMRIRAAGRAEVAWGRGCEAEEAVRSGGFNLGFGGTRHRRGSSRDNLRVGDAHREVHGVSGPNGSAIGPRRKPLTFTGLRVPSEADLLEDL